jgi:hypothetical protein
MKLLLGLCFYLVASFTTLAFGQTLNCSSFRDGKFKIVAPAIGTYIIERKGEIQTEASDKDPNIYSYLIKWIDDCTYTLTPTKETLKLDPTLPENVVLTVKIIETRPNSYLQTTTSNYANRELTCELIRINKK